MRKSQESPRRTVALKIPRGGKLLESQARQRFLREVELAANADHTGIVPVLGTDESQVLDPGDVGRVREVQVAPGISVLVQG